MSDYPEHDKQALVIEQTQAIGEFLDWLGSQGVNLMVWREDLTDSRPTDPECPKRQRDRLQGLPCQPTADDATRAEYYFRAHCMHWNDPEREADSASQSGICCYCGKDQHYEVTGLRSWVHESRSTMQLLADWAGIDLKKIETEKRQMLASLRAANAS
jgi:hypothetical protein